MNLEKYIELNKSICTALYNLSKVNPDIKKQIVLPDNTWSYIRKHAVVDNIFDDTTSIDGDREQIRKYFFKLRNSLIRINKKSADEKTIKENKESIKENLIHIKKILTTTTDKELLEIVTGETADWNNIDWLKKTYDSLL